MPKDTIGDRVAYAIRRSRKKLEQVADEANVTPAWLSALKNDRIQNPSADKVRAIAIATGHPISYFAEPLGWADEGGDYDWVAWLASLKIDEEGKAAISRMIRHEIAASEKPEPTPVRQDRTKRRAV